MSLLLVAPAANGQLRSDQTIVPLLPRIDPPIEDEMASRFQQVLAEAATAAGYATVEPGVAQAATERANGLMTCADAQCAARTQGQLQIGWSLCANIKTVGKNYAIEVVAHRGTRSAGTATGRCDICTFKEALDRTRELGAQALSQAEAELRTPASSPPPGPPQREATTSASQPTGTQPGTTAAPRRRPWPLWPALTAAGLGVVGLAVGIPLIAIDGNGTDCRGQPRNDYRNCQRLYDTSGAGWALTTIGVAALATSGVLLYLHMVSSTPQEPESTARTALGLQRLSLWPSGKGLVFGAGGNF